ncbi:MAG: dihydrofolate reductase [Corallococcus sp.]|nr:dihydrofolate reductase [Corallococcus sp.]MCM1359863.1 dihydrofolate reductase [Corallococcus sp.]MCM1395297.1 dihydrofolate reductase [Corallococcus sp.]
MNLIVVVDEKWGIGKNNGLLFRLPRDMRFFREKTGGKVVVMGANTFRSFPNGALPNRINIVLDASGARHEGAVTVSTVDELETELQKYNSDDVFVCGGASFYQLMLPRCKTAFVTKVGADGGAQLFFPDLDQLPNWQLVFRSEPQNDNGYEITFCTYQNVDI